MKNWYVATHDGKGGPLSEESLLSSLSSGKYSAATFLAGGDANGELAAGIEQVGKIGKAYPGDETLPTIAATICQPDGRIRYITQVPPHGGSLSVAERQAILTAHGAPSGSVLLLESEKYS